LNDGSHDAGVRFQRCMPSFSRHHRESHNIESITRHFLIKLLSLTCSTQTAGATVSHIVSLPDDMDCWWSDRMCLTVYEWSSDLLVHHTITLHGDDDDYIIITSQ
jgi:hypothetical protein